MRVASVLAAVAVAEYVLQGETGQVVSGCRCEGTGANGHCSYHFHFGSNEKKPWCRTKYNCGFPGSMLKGSRLKFFSAFI
mmetsp:Transcript_29746/g.76350  ORF Transcript_29746/g.76350 Transcript_29746/m.76350 type:complete len:80 (-) Transcript_29746:230-469(-)